MCALFMPAMPLQPSVMLSPDANHPHPPCTYYPAPDGTVKATIHPSPDVVVSARAFLSEGLRGRSQMRKILAGDRWPSGGVLQGTVRPSR